MVERGTSDTTGSEAGKDNARRRRASERGYALMRGLAGTLFRGAEFSAGWCRLWEDGEGVQNILLAKRHPHPHFMVMSEMTLRVVLYREDGLWVAHSLEMDVIGVGPNREDALAELKGNVEAQLSFARFKNISPFRNAPDAIQRLWEKENLAMLGIGGKGKAGNKAGKSDGGSSTLRLSGADVSRTKAIHFQCA